MRKKLFKHGGSYAVDLPMSFVREARSGSVLIERSDCGILITPQRELDTIEQEPEFKSFVSAVLQDALRRPSTLQETKNVWDKEWDALLKDVPRGED